MTGFLATILAVIAAVTPNGLWAQTLNDLDAQRNAAFVHSDGARLEQVYTDGSTLLRTDRRTLRAYRRRGLEIDRVSLHLIDVDLISRRGDTVRLRVVDQLRPAQVREPGGAWQPLPRDRPTERTIVLKKSSNGWRITKAGRTAG